MIFTGARHFRELLAGEEGISSNTLADRLALLVEHGFLTRAGDPSHTQKVNYSVTEQAIELVPVFVALSDWGVRYLPVDPALAARAAVLVNGGPEVWEAFMPARGVSCGMSTSARSPTASSPAWNRSPSRRPAWDSPGAATVEHDDAVTGRTFRAASRSFRRSLLLTVTPPPPASP